MCCIHAFSKYENIQQWASQSPSCFCGVCILVGSWSLDFIWGAREGFLEEVAAEPRTIRKSVPGRRNSMCKCPEVGGRECGVR